MTNLIDTAKTLGGNLEYLEAMRNGKVYSDAEGIEAFESSVAYGREQLVGNRFPEINEAIRQGREEVRKEFNL